MATTLPDADLDADADVTIRTEGRYRNVYLDGELVVSIDTGRGEVCLYDGDPTPEYVRRGGEVMSECCGALVISSTINGVTWRECLNCGEVLE